MISRHPKPRIAVAFAAWCAWLICAAMGCSSGDLEPSSRDEAVANAQQAVDSFCTFDPSIHTDGSARSPTDWKSLGGSNFLPAMDVNTDLACVLGIYTPGQVLCYVPDKLTTPANFRVTNWGTGCGGSGCTGVPIASSPPKGVAILKHTEKPRRDGGANYGIYVLLQDNRVMVTRGDSDHWFEGDNFKSYSLFISPVSSYGQTLSFQKIVWVNEVGMTDFTVVPRLLGLTTDNALYYTDYTGAPWQLFKQSVRDISHLPGRGDTMVLTTGEVYYGAFNPSNEWRGYLPPPLAGSNIVAVGGVYALTNDGCHGNCADNMSTFCSGDDTRILRFDWLEWKWKPLAWIARFTNGYYPIEPAYTCNGCSPQVTKTIVDPHGWGGNVAPIDSFNVGPFVYTPVGQRIQYYNPPTYPITADLQQCMNGACVGDCGQLSDGTPCPPDGVGARVCENRQCVACGGAGQFPCPGLDCSKVPGGGIVHYGRCRPRSDVFAGWRQMPGGAGAYSAPAANRRHEFVDLYAKRIDTGDLHFRAGRFSNTDRTWDWGTWTSLGRPANGIMGKPSSTGWQLSNPAPCTSWPCPPPYEGGAVVVRTQDGNVRHIAVNFLDAAGNFQGWSQIPGGDLEQDPTITWMYPYLYVFAPGQDHQFWFSKNNITGGYNAANWTGWQHIPGGWLTSEGSAAADGSTGTLYLASRGTNNLYHVIKSTDGGASWGNWNYVPSPVTFLAGPQIVWDQGELMLLGTAASADGNQRTFFSRSSSPTEFPSWSPFESTDPYPVGQPAAVITGYPYHDWSDHIEIFVLGTDNQLWRTWYQ